MDNGNVLFKIQLANYLIPGPMAYSFNTDCVVIANSNLQIESYSYQSMKAFTNNDLDA